MKLSLGCIRRSFLIIAIAFSYPAAAQMSSTFMSGAMYGHYYHYVDPVWLYEKRKSEGRDVTNFQREKSGVGIPFADIKIIKRDISIGVSDDQVAADSSADVDKKTKFMMHFSSEAS